MPAAEQEGISLVHPMQHSADIGLGQVCWFAGKESGSVRLDQNKKTAGAGLLNRARQGDSFIAQLIEQASELRQAVALS